MLQVQRRFLRLRNLLFLLNFVEGHLDLRSGNFQGSFEAEITSIVVLCEECEVVIAVCFLFQHSFASFYIKWTSMIVIRRCFVAVFEIKGIRYQSANGATFVVLVDAADTIRGSPQLM